jgi:hypothetical protein
MWIFSKVGFYSVVQKPGQSYLTVRSRVREDLENLRETYIPGLSVIMAGGGTDYPYRALISHKHFGNGLAEMGNDIHYSNFKNEVASNDMARANVYGNFWSNMHNTGKQHQEEAALKRLSVGGVVFNEYNEILLVEPADHFDGYVWTFPKGSPNKGESFESTAKREVLEETGVVAEIVGLVPGQFEGGTTVNSYFIMRTTGHEGLFVSNEVMNTAWVSSGRAAAMITQTTNKKGQQRDLEILKAAIDSM